MPDPDYEQLLSAYVAGGCPEDEVRVLADAVERDPALRRRLAEAVAVDRMLRQAHAPALDADCVLRALPTAHDSALEERVIERISAIGPAPAPRRFPGWRVAAVAAVLLIGLLIGTAVVLRPAGEADPATALARLRGTSDAVWNGTPPSHQLAAGRIDLASGLAEFAFASGATVVLEGPAVLDLQTADRVRLETGRACAHVPPAAHGFAIAAPGAEVIDLGTEFGIAVNRDGRSDVQVFRGSVEARLLSAAGVHQSAVLTAAEAVRLDPAAVRIAPITPDASRFTRSLRPVTLVLDICDLIGGGDGRGNATHAGLDPRDGRIADTPPLGIRTGDRTYHPCRPRRFIDGVFVPSGNGEPDAITSTGLRFAFPRGDGRFYDLVRRGGTLDRLPAGAPGPMRIRPIFGGVDYDAPGRTAIGLHANMGFTIDLHALGAARDMRATRFTAEVANIGRKKTSTGRADFWILIDGRLVAHHAGLVPDSPPVAIDLPFSAADRFLTLVSTDGGNGLDYDWVTLGDARLHLAADVAGSAP